MAGKMDTTVTTIDAYIAQFPNDIQQRLQEVRKTIQKAAPGATEAIKYAMPTFVLNGNLVHFAAFKNHIGFYPTPTGVSGFVKDLAPYVQGKGSVQFPLDKKTPLALIRKIVLYRVREMSAKGRVSRNGAK